MYLENDTLYLVVVCENFRRMCLKIYHLDAAKFISALGLAWQLGLEKAEVELESSSNTDMLSMVEKAIIGGICHTIHWYAKSNNKYTKEYDKIKNHHILNIGM